MKNKWTILIYANGNNELEPEIYDSLICAEKYGSNNDVKVLMQISRSYQNRESCDAKEEWSGSRRYFINKPKSILLNELGKINMADPNNLYDFIKWGIESYEAEHYMLVISGHGVSCIGALTESRNDKYYLMGIPQMVMAIDLAEKEVKSKLDILILDMCYMNNIEVLYELAKFKNTTTKTMITYIQRGPYSGIPYDKLMLLVNENLNSDNINLLTYKIAKESFNNLIAFEINHEKIEKIKRVFNEMAKYLYPKKDMLKNTFDFRKLEGDKSMEEYKLNINEIIIYKPNGISNNFVNITFEDLRKLIKIYCKLAFAKNNCWTRLLSNENIDDYLNQKVEMKSIAFNKGK